MKKNQKLLLSFICAVALHLTIIGMFGFNFGSGPEVVRQKPLPEIIQASVLDDEKIQEEANRLKNAENKKKLVHKKKQQALENKRKKEQKLLHDAKKKRQQEEKKAKELEKKGKELVLKEKQKLEAIKKQKVLEAAKLAKIKEQKAVEEKHLNDLRKAEKKKRELERLAEQKKQQELIAKTAKKEALIKKQLKEAKAKTDQDRRATISSTVAIQRKVNNHWIKPILLNKGLSCTIEVALLPSGDVMNVTVIKSSGDSIFDRSAENAVRKASPLPVPKDRALFAKKFRIFTFVFDPE